MIYIVDRLARLIRGVSHEQGLNPAQWDALRFLDQANRFSRSPGAVTAYLGSTKGTVSQTLQALERKGLIRKTAQLSDRRGVQVDLTERGRDVLKEDPMRALEEALSALPADERAAVRDGLEKIIAQMLAAREGRPFGVCQTCKYFIPGQYRGGDNWCSLLDLSVVEGDENRLCIEHEPPPG